MVSQFCFKPLLFLFFLLPAANSDLAADRAALIRLSSAVHGRTTQWNLADPSPCWWKGVYCDNKNSSTARVTQLRLPGAGLSGVIPINSIGSLTHLRNLSLRRNSLSGSLPADLSFCTHLQNLFLQENQFSGEIPATLLKLNNLVQLNLAGNDFSGEIPPEFNNLARLRTLFLESNSLSGSIPEMRNLSSLRNFNVSDNKLNGSIPSSLKHFLNNSFRGNSLCGSPLAACPSNGKNGSKLSAGAIAGIAIGSVLGLVLVLVVLFFLWMKKGSDQTTHRQAETPRSPVKPQEFEYRSPKPIVVRENSGVRNGDSSVVVNVDGLVFFGNGVLGFGLEELLRASAEVLAKGTIGSTYKAYLEGQGEEVVVVVVKRLRSVCVYEREFREKVEGLGVLEHENLVPLKAYYYGREEKLLIFDWMPMGSLSSLLHGNTGADTAALTWEIRAKIAFGAAHGIEYLHSLGPYISHGNIKSSNILLTDYYGACVSEYGIAQLVPATYTLDMNTLDLNAYSAPEVTDSRKVSQKADVYSFGIVVLELLTGKSPTDTIPNEERVDLPRWVRSMVKENQTHQVFDPEIVRDQNREEKMVRLLHLGIHCTFQHPEKRPSMVEVTRQIREVVD